MRQLSLLVTLLSVIASSCAPRHEIAHVQQLESVKLAEETVRAVTGMP